MAQVEMGRAPLRERLEVVLDARAVIGVHAIEPRARAVADLVLVATDEGEPLGREMDAAGTEIPVPQRLARPEVPAL